MKRFLLFMAILLLLGNPLSGQECYMYVDGKKKDYKVSPNKMLVHYFYSSIDSGEIKSSLQRMSVKMKNITTIYDGVMLIDLENTSKKDITDVDIIGMPVLQQSVQNFNTSFDLDLSTVPDGLYVFRMVQDGKPVHTQNILVQH